MDLTLSKIFCAYCVMISEHPSSRWLLPRGNTRKWFSHHGQACQAFFYLSIIWPEEARIAGSDRGPGTAAAAAPAVRLSGTVPLWRTRRRDSPRLNENHDYSP